MIPTPNLEFAPVLPELFLCGVAIAGLLYEALAPKAERLWHLALAFAGLIAAALATFPLWHWSGERTVMGQMVSVDRFSVVSRLLLLGIAATGLLLGTHYFARSSDTFRGEFYPLVLFATAGMTLITAAADLILVFLALEILSLSLYVLTGITGRRTSNEAAMKYFLLGAFSSAFFLFGSALLFGYAGSLNLGEIAKATSEGPSDALEARGSGRAVRHGDAVQEECARERAQQEVLHGRLVGLDPVGEARQHVQGEREDLQRKEHHDQVGGRRDQCHARGREQHQRIELPALVLRRSREVVRAVEQADRGDRDEQEPRHHRVAVGRHRAGQDRGSARPVPQGVRGVRGAAQPNERQGQVDAPLRPGRERLVHHRDEPGADQDHLGQDRQPLDVRRGDRDGGSDDADHGVAPCSMRSATRTTSGPDSTG